MRKYYLTVPLRRSELLWGFGYLLFDFLVLPVLLPLAMLLFGGNLSLAQMNFIYYFINFAVVLYIFRRFLLDNFTCFAAAVLPRVYMVAVYLAAYFLMNSFVGSLVFTLDPGFANLNDAAITSMAGEEFTLMVIGTVLLVPVTEECLFRGLIFRGLYDKSRALAWIASVAGFAAVHVVSYIGMYTPMQLLLSFVMYLPAGICLGVAYVRSDTIFVPILIHTLVNAIGMHAMR